MTNNPPFLGHPKLKDPTVTMVIFEMAFEAAQPIGQVVAQMYKGFKGDYPKLAQRWGHKVEVTQDPQNPGAPHFTASVAPIPPHEPQFKLHGDTPYEIHLGEAFLQFVFRGDYVGWKDFLMRLEYVLRSHHEIASIDSYTAFKLLYANRISWSQGIEDKVFEPWVLPSRPPLPDLIEVDSRQQRVVIQLPDGEQQIIVTAPGIDDHQPETPIIQLDIDHHIEFDPPQQAAIEDLLAWLEIAHERIYQTFKCALTEEFLEERS